MRSIRLSSSVTSTRIEVEVAMAMMDVIRADEMSRLGVCDDETCQGLVLDLSKNRSRRYCSVACGNRNAVAAGCSIEFLRPTHAGDVLTCEGLEQTLSGRHGIYDMKVTNQRGEVVALFRGKSAQIAGTVFPEEDPS